jgi:hypothetical protein
MSADTRQQSATSANAGGNNLLSETLSSLVSAVDGYDETFIFSKLTALFHTVQQRLAGVDVVQILNAKNCQRVGLPFIPFNQP